MNKLLFLVIFSLCLILLISESNGQWLPRRHYCIRRLRICSIHRTQQVCGYYKPGVRCRPPCSHTYRNYCEACKDRNILSYTYGPCPRTR